MKKIDLNTTWFSNFSANILGVIIGIALTFGITFLVQRHQERKQTREMLSLVRQEILDNKNWLATRAHVWEKDFNAYWGVLWEQGWPDLTRDSMDAISLQIRMNPTGYTGTYIWNTLQYSGMVQKLHNVDMVATLSQSYFWMEEMKTWWERYSQGKEKLSGVYLAEFHDNPEAFMRALLANRETYRVMENVARFNQYNFPDFYETFGPLYDYAVFLIDNYDQPRKTAGVNYETFRAMQAAENN